MTKQHILAAAAAVLSLLIVFGGWFLTTELLDRQHLNLMNTAHSIKVQESSDAKPGVEPAKAALSTQEIANILKTWRSGQMKRYHDPYESQLTMEEAIMAANSALSYFGNHDVLPKALFVSDFTQTSAFLYDVLGINDVQAARTDVAEVVPVLNPAYSFWSVNLSNRQVSVELTLNALTGRIWMADISSSSVDVNFDGIKTLDVLERYETYLGLSSGSGLRSNEAYASKSYDNNQIGVTVYKNTGESGHYGTLHFSLISTR